MCSICDGTGKLLGSDCPLCDDATQRTCRACHGIARESESEACPLCEGVVGWPQCEDFTELTVLNLAGVCIKTVGTEDCIELQTVKRLRRWLQMNELMEFKVVACKLSLEGCCLEDDERLACGRLCGSQQLQAIFLPSMGKAKTYLQRVQHAAETGDFHQLSSYSHYLKPLAALKTLEKSDDEDDREVVKRLFPLMANWLTTPTSVDTATHMYFYGLGSFAVRRMKHTCRVEYLPALIHLLDDECSVVRYEALRCLTAILKEYRIPSDQHAAKTLVLAKSPTPAPDECPETLLALHELYSAVAQVTEHVQ